jgi:hypothetical protein
LEKRRLPHETPFQLDAQACGSVPCFHCEFSRGFGQLREKSHLNNQLAYQRGIEAVIWSMPAISIREF